MNAAVHPHQSQENHPQGKGVAESGVDERELDPQSPQLPGRKGAGLCRLYGWLERLAAFVASLFVLSVMSFLVGAVAPGDAAATKLRVDSLEATQAQVDAVRAELGLDKPMWLRYLDYLGDIFSGDLGTSVITGQPVAQMLAKAFPATVILTLVSILITIVLIAVLGSAAAKWPNGIVDRVVSAFCYLGSSMPSFWLGLLFISFFSVRLGWFPTSGWQGGKGVVLPALVLAIAVAPPFIKIFKERFIEVQQQFFVTAAQARGIPERLVVLRHILRGTFIPMITMLSVSMAAMLGGTVVVEVVFGLPGVGNLAFESIVKRDWIFVQGFVFVVGVITLVLSQISDALCQVVDPSTRLRRQTAAGKGA